MPDELTAFENDKSPDAYERQVDRLLATPTFGEATASSGSTWPALPKPTAMSTTKSARARRYRDWVIGALNADMPYDEFVRQQIAGDASEANATVATTFCLAGPDMPDVNDQLERRHVLMNEMTATVGAVFLGLQLGCAQCHNHKYDPISQADFYRLRAVFEPAVATLKRDVPFNVLVTQKDPSPARFWVRGDHRRPGVEVPPAFPRIASPTLARSASEGRRVRMPPILAMWRAVNPRFRFGLGPAPSLPIGSPAMTILSPPASLPTASGNGTLAAACA